MAVKFDLHKIKTSKGKISKIFQICSKHGVSSLPDESWMEIQDICDSINGRFGRDTIKFKCLLTLANPRVLISQKDKICSQLNFSVAFSYRSEFSKELLHKFITPSFIEYICFKYPTSIDSVINVSKLPPYELSHLIDHSPLFANKILTNPNDEILNTLFQSDRDMKEFLGETLYFNFINKKLDKYYKNKLARYDEKILIKNQQQIDKMFKAKFPQLELYSQVILNSHNEVSDVSLKIIKNLEPMDIKDYLKQNYGFSSSKMIHYIQNNIPSLAQSYDFIKTLSIYRSVIKDHNLIWHILDNSESNKHETLISKYFSEDEFVKNKDLLSETQWSLFFKTLNHYLKTEANRTVENLRDSFRMISDVAYQNKQHELFKALKDNYRFQEYNTPEKLHEVLIVLYNKALNKEYPLNLDQQYPNILDHHGFALTSSLSLHIPKVSTELTVWGQRLRICVGSYSRNVANGETLVVGITENGQIKYCAEVNPSKVSLIQLRGFRNDDAPKEVFTAFKAWMEAFKPNFLAAQEHKLKYDISILQEQIPKLEEYFKKIKVEIPSEEDEDFNPIFHRLHPRMRQEENIGSVEDYFKDLRLVLSPEYLDVLKKNLNFVATLKHHHSRILKMEHMMGTARMDMFMGLGLHLGHTLFYFISDSHHELKRILAQKHKQTA